MKTRIREMGKVTLVEMSGYLDFETARPAAETIQRIYDQNQSARVVVDMSKLNFVGSSGISAFVKSLRNYNSLSVKPAYFGLKSEFLKIFRTFEEDEGFEICETQATATSSALSRYQQWEMRSTRSRSTH